jgi:hypothetical protein
MRKLLFIVIMIALPACNFLSLPTPDPSEIIVFKPSATATLIPLPTSTEIPPTVSPVPTADPNFSREDFDSTFTAPWMWVREDPKTGV